MKSFASPKQFGSARLAGALPNRPEPGRRALLAAALACLGGGLLPAAFARPAASGGTMRALVIGNASYADAPLRTAAQDAHLIESVLTGIGFGVDVLVDANRDSMLRAFAGFVASSATAAVRLLYFAGHGAQYRGRNFLIPVDSHLLSEDELPGKALDVHDIVDRMSRFDTGVNLLIFDACRAVPTRPAGPQPRSIEAPAGGFAPLVAPRGTVVVYATAPDRLAIDSLDGAHSPFTRRLAEEMKVPGVPIEVMLKRVRTGVMHDTGNRQVPWDSSSLVGDFCLAEDPGHGACGAPAGGGHEVDLSPGAR